VVSFKGEGDIPAPIERVASVIFDTTRATEWVSDLAESKIVKWTSKDEYVEYDRIKTPPVIMKDREFVSRVKLTVDPKLKEMSFAYVPTEVPETPLQGKYVRGSLLNSGFVLRGLPGGKGTHLVGEMHCDPKGGVPKWLVNWFQKGWPSDTFKNLKKQVAKEDIRLDDHVMGFFAAGASK